MKETFDRPLAVDAVLRGMCAGPQVTPPRDLESRVMAAVQLERSRAQFLLWSLAGPAALAVACAVSWLAFCLWQGGILTSWTGSVYGRLVAVLANPSPEGIASTAILLLLSTTLVALVAAKLAGWANIAACSGRPDVAAPYRTRTR